LDHRDEAVRAWTIRFLGDQHNVTAALEDRLQQIGATDRSPVVLAQLACSAKRLPALCGLRIAARIAENPAGVKDRYVPLLIWWAVESHATADRAFAVETFASKAAWQTPLVRDVIVGRLLKRYAAEGTPEGFAAAARIFQSAPAAADKTRLLAELDEGLQMIGAQPAKELPLGSSYTRYAAAQSEARAGRRRLAALPPELRPLLEEIWSDRVADPLVLRVACRLGSADAYRRVIQLVAEAALPPSTRHELLRILGEMGDGDCVAPVLAIVRKTSDDALRTAALSTLGHFDEPRIAEFVLAEYPKMSAPLRTAARSLLFSRPDWARKLLASIDRGAVPAADVQTDELRRVALYNDSDLDARVRKRWGNIRAGTPEEKLADIRRLSNDLRAAAGRPSHGHELFKKSCATCHTLFGEGTKIGPDLTTANRKDRDFLLVSIVDPSVQIRKEFLAYVVTTNDGRVVTGLIAEQSPSSIIVVGPKNEHTAIPRREIEEIKESPQSLMPERLLDPLKPQEVRDLFSYLQE